MTERKCLRMKGGLLLLVFYYSRDFVLHLVWKVLHNLSPTELFSSSREQILKHRGCFSLQEGGVFSLGSRAKAVLCNGGYFSSWCAVWQKVYRRRHKVDEGPRCAPRGACGRCVTSRRVEDSTTDLVLKLCWRGDLGLSWRTQAFVGLLLQRTSGDGCLDCGQHGQQRKSWEESRTGVRQRGDSGQKCVT